MIEEIAWAKKAFPQVKEFFFDDDTFTDNLPRAEAIARELGKLGVTWSCNAKANVPRETLKVLKDNGLRLLLVGYESGNQQILHNIKKGMRDRGGRAVHQGLPRARHRHPRHLHPRPAGRDPGDDRGDHPLRHQDQSAHHPGVAGRALSRHLPLQAGGGERLARRRRTPNWWTSTASRSRRCTIRTCRHTEIFDSVETFYKRFYFRAAARSARSSARWCAAREMMKRRLREGVEFFQFLRERHKAA